MSIPGDVYWHEIPHCVECGRKLEDGEIVYPLSGSRNGVLCARDAGRLTLNPGSGYVLRVSETSKLGNLED